MYINNTGVRCGERIIGIGKQCKGSVILIVGGFYPPSKSFIDDLLIRDRFPSYDFFSNMGYDNTLQYLIEYGIDSKDLYLDDVQDIIVKFEVLSGEYFGKYPEICTMLISNGPMRLLDAYNMFPKNLNSRARKHTLVFRPSNWTLKETISKKYDHCVDVLNGCITLSEPNYVIDNVGYLIPTGIVLQGRTVIDEMKWYSPSFLKSIIQKIIRTRCSTVIFHDLSAYESITVLHSAITCLLEHPGSFVPNIQRFVKGSESCFKRLAVSIVEDSYIENTHDIYILLINALLLQREPSYIPSKESLDLLYDVSTKALNSPYCYSRCGNYSCDLTWFPLCSNVLRSIGSFKSDIDMFIEYTSLIGCSSLRTSMNIWHAIDHHCYSNIGWFCDMDRYDNYTDLFRDIWELSSKYNPRRGYTYNDIFNDAQLECYLFHRPNNTRKELPSTTITISYTLNYDLIHSIIGTIYYDNYIITRLGTCIARKPKRDDPNYVKIPITDEERLGIISKNLFVGLKRVMPVYSNVIIDCKDGKNITIYYNNTWHRWEDLMKITMNVNVVVGYRGLITKIRNLSPHIKKRLFMYINTWGNTIDIHRIGRDGKGVKYSVSKLDSYVFRIIMDMCKYLPNCIKMENGTIHITNQVMFWYFRYLIGFKSLIDDYSWIYGHDSRVLYPYQVECLDKLIECKTNGSILWIDVGMGKTLIVLEYLKYLMDNSIMTSYCCYTLPPSALDSIVREIEMSGIKYNILDMRKGSLNNTLEQGCINLIYHDHLRLGNIAEQLRSISDNLTFIIDEFHQCLSSTTIRTSITLEIAKLSHRFVAMSGTILNSIDAVDDMVEWLGLTVPYPIHKNNYQVAISELISFQTELSNIKIVRSSKDIKLIDEEEYKKYVPSNIGGTSNRLHLHEALRICYNTVLPAMAEYAKSIVDDVVFIVVKDTEQQDLMAKYLHGYRVHLITHNTPITLMKNDITDIRFIITTMKHSMGYTITKSSTMITSVYPSNESSRTQIEGRLYRIGQDKDVNIITFHTGILSYIYDKHRKTGNMNKILKELIQ